MSLIRFPEDGYQNLTDEQAKGTAELRDVQNAVQFTLAGRSIQLITRSRRDTMALFTGSHAPYRELLNYYWTQLNQDVQKSDGRSMPEWDFRLIDLVYLGHQCPTGVPLWKFMNESLDAEFPNFRRANGFYPHNKWHVLFPGQIPVLIGPSKVNFGDELTGSGISTIAKYGPTKMIDEYDPSDEVIEFRYLPNDIQKAFGEYCDYKFTLPPILDRES